jgi:hypothetical protein
MQPAIVRDLSRVCTIRVGQRKDREESKQNGAPGDRNAILIAHDLRALGRDQWLCRDHSFYAPTLAVLTKGVVREASAGPAK